MPEPHGTWLTRLGLGPTSPHMTQGLVRRLAQRLPPSLWTFPAPFPRLPGTPVPPRSPIADGRAACSTSSMPSAHGHYVMIR